MRTYGAALAVGVRYKHVYIDREASRINRFRTAPGRAVWRRTERDLEEESVVFSNIKVRVKRAGP